MKHASSFRWTRAALALAALLTVAPALADIIAAGNDRFKTIQPTFFLPLGPLNPLTGDPAFGPADTIVQRLGDCNIDFSTAFSQCTVLIEMLALNLVSTVDPNAKVRESPTIPSTGAMVIVSDGSGGAGTFDSFFDVFVELSFDGGSTWIPVPQPERLISDETPWHITGTTFVVPFVSEASLLAQHTATRVAEPGALALFGLGLAALGWRRRGMH